MSHKRKARSGQPGKVGMVLNRNDVPTFYSTIRELEFQVVGVQHE